MRRRQTHRRHPSNHVATRLAMSIGCTPPSVPRLQPPTLQAAPDDTSHDNHPATASSRGHDRTQTLIAIRSHFTGPIPQTDSPWHAFCRLAFNRSRSVDCRACCGFTTGNNRRHKTMKNRTFCSRVRSRTPRARVTLRVTPEFFERNSPSFQAFTCYLAWTAPPPRPLPASSEKVQKAP